MSKIWIVENYKKANKLRNVKIYRNESQLLKSIRQDSDQMILEYDLKSSTKSSDFFKEKERDIQLRSVLGELDTNEESRIKLISIYEELAPENIIQKKSWNGSVIGEYSKKKEFLKSLKKYQSDKDSFCKFLTENKGHVMTVLTTIDWYKAILSVHNFRDCRINGRLLPTEEMIENFNIAKKKK